MFLFERKISSVFSEDFMLELETSFFISSVRFYLGHGKFRLNFSKDLLSQRKKLEVSIFHFGEPFL